MLVVIVVVLRVCSCWESGLGILVISWCCCLMLLLRCFRLGCRVLVIVVSACCWG